jgi:RNA-directed DNA polymerase
MTRRTHAPATEEHAEHQIPGIRMEEVATDENLRRAHQRVRRNGGAPGPDGMSVEDLDAYVEQNLDTLRAELREGKYRPRPVRGVTIPKPGGGERLLGIPDVLDRLVQQALLQALTPTFDPGFSEASWGFRPGRSQHGALRQAMGHIRGGHDQVVNIDLARFFDTVQHDILMARVGRKVRDKRILKLIGRFLRAGMMLGGVVSPRAQGTPQGGPLSPLLSNVLLDELDKELEERGHLFVRYADDFLIFKRTERAAWRTKTSVTRFLEKRLRLRVNEEKSSVERPATLVYLGYTFTARSGRYELRAAPKSVKRLKERLRPELTRLGRGRSIERTVEQLNPILRGWANYYRRAPDGWIFQRLDTWIRRHLRCLTWRQWGRSFKTRRKRLIARGVREARATKMAATRKGPWRASRTPQLHIALPNRYFHEDLGLVSLQNEHRVFWQRA